MASSRRHERPSEPAADLLNSLPAHLLDAILNRLDLRDTVRTSALSRAWRRRWEALPYLSLSFLDNPSTPPVAVDSILLRYPGHISHFSFQLDEHSVGRVADWLIALCNRGVESINLQHSPSALAYFLFGFALHSSVFLCTQLVHLELRCCRIPPLPVGFIGFPVLEELKLHAAKFPENEESQLEAILGASPMLNTLSLSFVHIEGDGSNEWVIGGPNLRSLTIICFANYGWRVADLPCLDEATIDLENYVRSGDFEEFIARFAQVMKLILHTSYPPPTIARGGEDEIEANAVYQNTQLTDAFCANLQVVKIDGFGWFPSEMCFVKLVLSKAIVLLTMHLAFISLKSNKDAQCELMTYKRASRHAQVFFNGEMQ